MCSQIACKYYEFCEDGERKNIEKADSFKMMKVFGITIKNRQLIIIIVHKKQDNEGFNKCFK